VISPVLFHATQYIDQGSLGNASNSIKDYSSFIKKHDLPTSEILKRNSEHYIIYLYLVEVIFCSFSTFCSTTNIGSQYVDASFFF
jgi:hypothetical protein